MNYGTAELKVPVFVKHQLDTAAAEPFWTRFGEHSKTLEIGSGQLHMPAVTSEPGRSQIRLGSEKLQ
jgi:hypothetical protein